jgi:hypothetical protein
MVKIINTKKGIKIYEKEGSPRRTRKNLEAKWS